MGSQEDLKNQAFKVNDRRRFAADGSPVHEGEAMETPGETQEETEKPSASAAPESSSAPQEPQESQEPGGTSV